MYNICILMFDDFVSSNVINYMCVGILLDGFGMFW